MLTAAMDEAFAGAVRAVLVVGEPGVGKTRLVAEAARVARGRNGVVANAQCYGAAGRLALAPVAEWLAEPTLAAGIGSLPAVWRTEVERLVPRSDAGLAIGPRRRSPSTPGSGTASTRAWPRGCGCPSGRSCSCSTTSSGATRRRSTSWPSSSVRSRTPR